MSEPARESWQIESVGDWLEWRKHDITASRLPALFDLHPYLSRDQLADIMRGATSTGTASVPDNASMRRGRIFEAAVAAAIAEERPEWTLTKATTYHRVPSLRLGCTPDYFATSTLAHEPGRGIIQIKTAAPSVWERWHGRPPLGYTIQTLQEAMVCDCAWAWLVIMVMSDSYPVHYFAVPRHEAAERRIRDAVAEWWRAFDAGEIAGAAPSAELEADLDDGSYRDLSADPDLPPLLDERAALKATAGDAERRLKEIDHEIKTRVGRASRAWLPGWDISFATQHRKETLIPARDIRVLRVRALDGDAGEDAA